MPENATLTINSTASIVGTLEQPIQIDGAPGAAGPWGGITIGSGAAGTVIRHARISGASSHCIYIAGGVHEISRNIISGCDYGIQINSGAPRIENNLVIENSSSGVYVSNSSASPTLRYNTIDLNANYGLYFGSASDADTIVENNIITRNGTGWSNGANATRGYNNVWGNGTQYSGITAAATDLASDPEFIDNDRHLSELSPSRFASADGLEIGAYSGVFTLTSPTVDPIASPTVEAVITLTGTKAVETGIVINGILAVAPSDSSLWTAQVTLREGRNLVTVYAVDADARRSYSVMLQITHDSASPYITSSIPLHGASVPGPVSQVRLRLSESAIDWGKAIDLARLTATTQGIISGTWIQDGNDLLFTADAELAQDSYTATTILTDLLGNTAFASISFTVIDGTIPVSSPILSNLTFAGNSLIDGTTLVEAGTLQLNADDNNGISRVEFRLDGILFATDSIGSNSFSALLDIINFDDGSHQLEITAYDTLGNSTRLTRDLNFALAAPDAPVITSPETGLLTNQLEIGVNGHADKGSEVTLFNNGNPVAGPLALTNGQSFTATIPLQVGVNSLSAQAQNRGGQGPVSSDVMVTVDTTIPQTPVSLTATARASGLIALSWNAVNAPNIDGYQLYRAAQPFVEKSEANLVNSGLITDTRFEDFPGQDGRYFYRLVAVNSAGTSSALSNQASALTDGTPPRALSISYLPSGAFDPQTGRMGPGNVDVVVEVSEILSGTPFLTVTPDGGTPIAVQLNKTGETEYRGKFTISEETLSGTAYAVFSGYDRYGNRGTEIDAGSTLEIDTDGPAVVHLAVTPGDPIKNDPEPATLQIELELDDLIPPGMTPELGYILSGPGRNQQTIALTDIGDLRWSAELTLPADAGLNGSETLTLSLLAADDLGNPSPAISGDHQFQVYQGDLDPLPSPAGLTARALPEGLVELHWQPVDGAIDYQLFRAGPGDVELSAYSRTGLLQTWLDDTPEDGAFRYAVASIRQANGQEATSGYGEVVEVVADATPPEAPENFVLVMTGSGIRADWTAPAGDTALRYRLYRSASEIVSTASLTPILGDIERLYALDRSPSDDEHYYSITAIDAAGNESAPAPSSYFNFTLLPVIDLVVTQTDLGLPELTWRVGDATNDFNVYLLEAGQPFKLTEPALTVPYYTDTGYTDDSRRYAVAQVDAEAVEGPRREVLLPKLDIIVPADGLQRGIMNRLEYSVTNLGDSALSGLSIKAAIESYLYQSETVVLGAGESRVIPVVFGGHADLPDFADLTTTVEIEAETGEISRLIRTSEIAVGEGAQAVNLLTANFTRGVDGKVRFTLYNQSAASIDLVGATANGSADSDEIRFELTDSDGNVLSTRPFRQVLGTGARTLPDGRTRFRIEPGETFSSDPVSLPIPLAAPDTVFVHIIIDHIYYHLGETDQVAIAGVQSRRKVQLADVAYRGEITTITPNSSFGGEAIIINGNALDNDTQNPLAWVPLKLIITVNGFERGFDVVSDRDGNFSYAFQPLAGESGSYQVAVVHPELQDRPVNGTFTIGRVFTDLAEIKLSTPRNIDQSLKLRLTAGAGVPVNGVVLVFDPADQPLGQLPTGITLTLPAAVDLAAGATIPVTVNFRADNSAEADGVAILSLRSSDSGNQNIAKVRVEYQLSEALPVLFYTPGHLETGVALEGSSTETLTLENRGLATLDNLSLSIQNSDGSAAPAWVFISSPTKLDRLEVGETANVSFSANPSANVAEGVHEFRLHVTSDNVDPIDINAYVTVTQSGTGAVQFHIEDIFTGTLDTNGATILGVSGAQIRVQNEAVLTIDQTQSTDGNGNVIFTDLPVGRYKYKATAPNHQEIIGRFQVKPGITQLQELFLDYDLVTVEWSVTEVPLQDRYEITLQATYETDVPAPVVVMEPASINLPDMKVGEVHYGELTLTNYGLIRAEELVFQVPQDDNYRIELLGGLPTSLEAKERITVPYRIVALKTLEQAQDGGTGAGDCYTKKIRILVGYIYRCINGVYRRSAVYADVYRVFGSCSGPAIYAAAGGGGGGGGGGGAGGGGGVGGVGGGSGTFGIGGGPGRLPEYKPSPNPLGDDECIPAANPDEPDCDPHKKQKTDSSVQLVLREYQDQVEDMRVKIPGGIARIQRQFYDNDWYFEHERTRLKLTKDLYTGLVVSVDRGGVEYRPAVFGSEALFRKNEYRIVHENGEYLWESPQGDWESYDNAGRPLGYGRHTNTLWQFTYADDETVHPSSMLDRQGSLIYSFEYDLSGQLTSVQDRVGRRVEFGYTDDLLTLVTDVTGAVMSYIYDTKNRLIKKTDGLGRTVRIAYHADGDVASVSNDDGRATYFEFGYDKAVKERYAQIKTAAGKITEVWYNDDGDVLRVMVNGRLVRTEEEDGRTDISIDDKGNITRTTRDEWEKVTRVVYPDGSEASFAYENRFHQLKRRVDQRGIANEYSYDANGNLIQRKEAVGTSAERTITYGYDGDNQLTGMTLVGDADTETATTSLTYDSAGNIATLTDPEGHVTRFLTYDVMGNPLTVKDARGHDWSFGYDDQGRMTSKSDPEGNVSRYEYDAVGNRVAVIDASDQRFEFTYNQRDQILRSTDPLGHFSTIDYNSDGLPVLLTDESGRTVAQQYDNEERLQSSRVGSESEGYETHYQYDETEAVFANADKPVQVDYPSYSQRRYYDRMQRLVQSTDVLDADTEQSTREMYDVAGNVIAETDQEGRVTTHQYDALNRLSQSTDPAGGITTFAYNDQDKLIALTDPNGGITRFTYDRNGRMTAEIRPLGETTQYEYDEVGNRIAVTDAKGQEIRYQYSPANRLALEQHFAATDLINPVKTISYSYDAVGRLTGYDDGITSGSYGYDAVGRQISSSTDYGSFTLTTAYSYDANGQKASFTGPDGLIYRYHYDAANRLSAIELPNGERVTYNGYDWNSPNAVTLPGGSRIQYQYDALQRVTEIRSTDPIQDTLMDYRYERSPAGSITAKLTEHGDYQYQYDLLDRLIGADNPSLDDESYSYDPLGNRKTSANVAGEWQYDLNNRLLVYGNQSFQYDDNGNQIEHQTGSSSRHFVYDIKDRLIRVEDQNGSTVAEYYYDPFGRRLWKQVGGTRTHFAYADEGLVGEFDANGNVIKTYGYQPGSLWTTNPVFQHVNGQYYWYQNDHLATAQKLITNNGVVVWAGQQEVFGKMHVQITGIENNLRFPGQYWDGETGLHYNYFRDYDPRIGRYIENDPIGLVGGTNLYLYGFNNPASLFDPEGKIAPLVLLGYGVVGAIAYLAPVITGGVIGGEIIKDSGAHDNRNLFNEAPPIDCPNEGCEWERQPFRKSLFHEPFKNIKYLEKCNGKYTGREKVVDINTGEEKPWPGVGGSFNYGEEPVSWEHIFFDIYPGL
ncbi:MAG: right-handed parallel beta-helix repeat-containing protein [Gammaproteobacteria bacterium]|nr:right-handed parallel beta-helix repeat-containing protein [Gammaproteobacteria bacterium]